MVYCTEQSNYSDPYITMTKEFYSIQYQGCRAQAEILLLSRVCIEAFLEHLTT